MTTYPALGECTQKNSPSTPATITHLPYHLLIHPCRYTPLPYRLLIHPCRYTSLPYRLLIHPCRYTPAICWCAYYPMLPCHTITVCLTGIVGIRQRTYSQALRAPVPTGAGWMDRRSAPLCFGWMSLSRSRELAITWSTSITTRPSTRHSPATSGSETPARFHTITSARLAKPTRAKSYPKRGTLVSRVSVRRSFDVCVPQMAVILSACWIVVFGSDNIHPDLIDRGPYFVSQPQNVPYQISVDNAETCTTDCRTVSFDCEARGHPQPSYTWYEEREGRVSLFTIPSHWNGSQASFYITQCGCQLVPLQPVCVWSSCCITHFLCCSLGV